MIRLYNTLTGKIEEFEPISPPNVGIYSCGPTVYDHTHLGHMRTYVNTDVLRRVLESDNYQVKQVMNVTDVGHLFGDRDMGEDKLETVAKEKQKSAWEIAREYEKEFFETMGALNVKLPTIVCRATEHIQEMIALIKKIEGKGYTYKTSDGIYFDASKIADYNKLSGMPLEKLKEGARVEYNPEKRNPTDFALWKFSPSAGSGPKRQMEWDSPWGVGFPGWHIECSAMGMKYLGERFDIHTGGVDHIPVHHTNEIAQNKAATGHEVVNFWIHNEFLLVEGKKMSKSLGNFLWAQDLKERNFDFLALRYLFLTAHYRTQMNFTWQGLTGAQTALGKLRELVRGWKSHTGRKTITREDAAKAQSFSQKFQEKTGNDLNIPEALAVVWEVAKSNLPDPDKLDLVLGFDEVLGLDLAKVEKIEKVEKAVEELVIKREELRKKGKWQEADKLRRQIEDAGFVVEDTAAGSKLKRKTSFINKTT